MNKLPKIKKINKAVLNRRRTLSRLMAIQIFYQYNFLEHKKNIDEIKEDMIESYALSPDDHISSYRDKIDEEFLNNLILGLTLNEKIDEEIKEFLKDGFSLEKIEDVMQQILRLGTFELKFMLDTPYKVIIDEYVDIAACFYERKKVTFSNGILENLAKKFRAKDFIPFSPDN